MITGTQLIGGEESSRGSSTFAALNPASGETLEPSFYEGTIAEVDQAFRLAAEAIETFGRSSLTHRAALLDAIADSLGTDRAAIVARCQEETGYPSERVEGEFQRMLGLWRTFADVVREGTWLEARIDTALPDRKPLPKPDVRRVNYR